MRLSSIIKRRGFVAAAFFVAALAVAAAVKGPTPTVAQKAEVAPRVVAASFTSAWCSSCRILEPRLAEAMPAFKNAAIEFVEFDFTFGETAELAARADAHGLTRLYEANKGATGFTVLVDARSGEIIDTLTMNFTVADIKGALKRSLAIATHTDERAARPSAGP
jgi:thiol-disulfide isomerase/thioredoxin